MKKDYVITSCSRCGKEWDIYKYNLKKKKTTLCSRCIADDKIKWDTKDKQILSEKYRAMIQRCYNKNNPTYDRYGAIGVIVCDEWKKDRGAYINWCLSNGYKKGLHLDKDILSEKLNIRPHIYSPETCCFVSARENMENISSNRYITYNGEKKTVSQWARKLGIEHKTLSYRLELGWSDKKAIETKVGEIKPMAKSIEQYSVNNEFIASYESAREADRQTGISYKNISMNLRGKSKSAGGFRWKYKNQE